MSRRVGFLILAATLLGMAFIFPYFSYFSRSADLIVQSQVWPQEYFVGQPTAAPRTYLALGDSTAVGVGATSLEKSYPYQFAQQLAAQGNYIRVVNAARTGARIRNVVEQQLPLLDALQPDVVTISIGANDATHFTSMREYRGSLEHMMQKLSHSGATTLLSNTPQMKLVPALSWPLNHVVNRRAQQQNTVLNQLVIGEKIKVVDLYTQGALDSSQNPAYYASDKYHPSSVGYRIWADVFTAAWPGRL